MVGSSLHTLRRFFRSAPFRACGSLPSLCRCKATLGQGDEPDFAVDDFAFLGEQKRASANGEAAAAISLVLCKGGRTVSSRFQQLKDAGRSGASVDPRTSDLDLLCDLALH